MVTPRMSDSNAAPPCPTLNVLVPARNEQTLIGRCLEQLLHQDFTGRLRVLVAANACTDCTAGRARQYVAGFRSKGWELEVLELAQAGKPSALDAADARCLPGPRIYLDADVEISPDALTEVADLLRPGTGIHLAMPRRAMRAPRSLVSRSYLKVWRELPRIRNQHIGSGFYGVSERGRERWTTFPAIISDDDFVKLHFAPDECGIAERATLHTSVPEGLRELSRVRARWTRGTGELRRCHPELRALSERSRHGAASGLLRRPHVWPHVPTFALVALLAAWWAWRHRGAGLGRWERAERSRTLDAADAAD